MYPARTCIPCDHCARPRLCSNRSFVSGFDNNLVLLPALLWQTGNNPGHSKFAPLLICAFHPISLLIADVLIPRKPMRARPGYVSATFCGSSPQAAFFSTRSLARPRTRLPPDCTLSPLALVVLLPLLRVLCLCCRPEALKRRHR
jgi:hypothetical protein